jgi:hypothetical protein
MVVGWVSPDAWVRTERLGYSMVAWAPAPGAARVAVRASRVDTRRAGARLARRAVRGVITENLQGMEVRGVRSE